MRFGDRERELLRTFLEAETAIPTEPFTVLREIGRTSVLHPAMVFQEVDEVVLARLYQAGAFVVTGWEDGRVYSFGLAVDADELLDRVIRDAGGTTVIDEARAEVERLAEREVARRTRRRLSAERFGRVVYGIVLPLLLVLIAGVTLATVSSDAGVIVALVLVVVAVVTTGLDWTGTGIARWAETRAADWAERRLASWTEPPE